MNELRVFLIEIHNLYGNCFWVLFVRNFNLNLNLNRNFNKNKNKFSPWCQQIIFEVKVKVKVKVKVEVEVEVEVAIEVEIEVATAHFYTERHPYSIGYHAD